MNTARNQQLLQEVSYHLSYMNQTAVSFCQMYFNDSDVQSLISRTTAVDPFYGEQIIRRINKSLIIYEMVESVLLYNGETGLSWRAATAS